MHRIIAIVFLCLILPLNSFAADCGGSVGVSGTEFTAYDASQECVQDAVTAASAVGAPGSGYGNTVKIPAGEATWSLQNASARSGWYATIEITKDMIIEGAGTSATILTSGHTDPYASFFTFIPDATARNRLDADGTGIYEIKNIKFTDTTLGPGYTLMFYASGSPIVSRIKIHDNVFENSVMSLFSEGEVYGVFYNNTMTNSRGPKMEGSGVWPLENAEGQMLLGDATGWYVEDNTYTCAGGSCMIASNSNSGSGYVARYNEISGTVAGGVGLFESHGNQCCGIVAGQKTEIYGNKNTLSNASLLHRGRGGKHIVMFNHHTGDTGDLFVSEEYSDYMTSATSPNNLCADSDSTVQIPIDYPAVGWCFSGKVHNSYFFNNRKISTNVLITTAVNMDHECDTTLATALCAAKYETGPVENNPPEIVENREWFQDYAGGDGAAGVGCGATLPETCTYNATYGTGPGFWLTDQSCTNMPDLVGVNPATPISGTLYKCTSTDTWEAYYTPYTYPHPLREETVATTQSYTITGVQITGGN
jgi:hypothetical protein